VVSAKLMSGIYTSDRAGDKLNVSQVEKSTETMEKYIGFMDVQR